MAPSLDIIIVNWNTGRQLQRCIHSIAVAGREGLDLHRVLVIDNDSHDDSVLSLEADGLPLLVQVNDQNRGFAAACNQGARGATADYLLFLNPDTELFPQSLTVPVRYMERPQAADVGICGVRLVDSAGAPAVVGARFPKPGVLIAESLGLPRLWPSRFKRRLISAAECTSTRDIDQIIGAFYLVRRTLFEKLHGFDERFFVYFEEVDFSLRARQMGYRSVYLPEAEARHHGGLSSDQVRAARLFYSLRSRLLYVFKHYRGPVAWVLTVVTVAIEPWTRTGLALLRRSPREAGETLRAYRMLGEDWCRRVLGSR